MLVMRRCFQVMRGADKNVDFMIFDPRGDILAKHLWTNQGTTDAPVQTTGESALKLVQTEKIEKFVLVQTFN